MLKLSRVGSWVQITYFYLLLLICDFEKYFEIEEKPSQVHMLEKMHIHINFFWRCYLIGFDEINSEIYFGFLVKIANTWGI